MNTLPEQFRELCAEPDNPMTLAVLSMLSDEGPVDEHTDPFYFARREPRAAEGFRLCIIDLGESDHENEAYDAMYVWQKGDRFMIADIELPAYCDDETDGALNGISKEMDADEVRTLIVQRLAADVVDYIWTGVFNARKLAGFMFGCDAHDERLRVPRDSDSVVQLKTAVAKQIAHVGFGGGAPEGVRLIEHTEAA